MPQRVISDLCFALSLPYRSGLFIGNSPQINTPPRLITANLFLLSAPQNSSSPAHTGSAHRSALPSHSWPVSSPLFRRIHCWTPLRFAVALRTFLCISIGLPNFSPSHQSTPTLPYRRISNLGFAFSSPLPARLCFSSAGPGSSVQRSSQAPRHLSYLLRLGANYALPRFAFPSQSPRMAASPFHIASLRTTLRLCPVFLRSSKALPRFSPALRSSRVNASPSPIGTRQCFSTASHVICFFASPRQGRAAQIYASLSLAPRAGSLPSRSMLPLASPGQHIAYRFNSMSMHPGPHFSLPFPIKAGLCHSNAIRYYSLLFHCPSNWCRTFPSPFYALLAMPPPHGSQPRLFFSMRICSFSNDSFSMLFHGWSIQCVSAAFRIISLLFRLCAYLTYAMPLLCPSLPGSASPLLRLPGLSGSDAIRLNTTRLHHKSNHVTAHPRLLFSSLLTSTP